MINIETFTIKEYVLYEKQFLFEVTELREENAEYTYVNNPHDKIFRKALENKKEVAEIINKIIKENRIEEKQIEKYNSSYISNKLTNSECDVVYKIKNKDVYFLIEHQTKIDYSMSFRILKYQVEIMESALNNKKYKKQDYEYPLVIPIVIYTGKQKWNAQDNLREKQIKWKNYKMQEISKYNIIDINEIENKELLSDNLFISKLMVIEKSKTEKELEENLEQIIENMKNKKHIYAEDQMEFLERIIKLVLKEKLGAEKVKKLNLKMKEGGQMLAVLDMIANENLRIRTMGIREGRKLGRAEGERKGSRKKTIEIVKKLKKQKVDTNIIREATGLTKEEIEKL